MATKSLSIRIEEEMLEKIGYIADYEGRSANSQILILIRDCIEKYESKHGKIELGTDKKDWVLRSKNSTAQTRYIRKQWNADRIYEQISAEEFSPADLRYNHAGDKNG